MFPFYERIKPLLDKGHQFKSVAFESAKTAFERSKTYNYKLHKYFELPAKPNTNMFTKAVEYLKSLKSTPSAERQVILNKFNYYQLVDRKLRKQRVQNFFCEAFYIRKTWAIDPIVEYTKPTNYQSLPYKIVKFVLSHVSNKTIRRVPLILVFAAIVKHRYGFKEKSKFDVEVFSPDLDVIFKETLEVEKELIGICENMMLTEEEWQKVKIKYEDKKEFIESFEADRSILYANFLGFKGINILMPVLYCWKVHRKYGYGMLAMRVSLLVVICFELLELIGFLSFANVKNKIAMDYLGKVKGLDAEILTKYQFYKTIKE